DVDKRVGAAAGLPPLDTSPPAGVRRRCAGRHPLHLAREGRPESAASVRNLAWWPARHARRDLVLAALCEPVGATPETPSIDGIALSFGSPLPLAGPWGDRGPMVGWSWGDGGPMVG